jgi:hypothetical protein
MATKYIIVMTHERAIGDSITYYYKGQNKKGEQCFGFQRQAALRYSFIEEALRDKQIMEATNTCAADTFEVIEIRCRI